jgi:hypothetical protein
MTACQLAFASDDADERFCQDAIELVALARSSIATDYGMARILAGKDKDGIKREHDTYSDDLHRLHAGVKMLIPDDVYGGLKEVTVYFWQLCSSCDYPAAASILPFAGSVTADQCCRECDWRQSSRDAHRPFSFYRNYEPTRRTWKERDWDALQIRLPRYNAGDVDEDDLRDLGMAAERSHFWAQPDNVPHWRPTHDHPQDVLHTFNDGVLSVDFAFVRVVLPGLTDAAINAAVRAYPHWPKGQKPPPLFSKAKGAYGIPKSDAHCKDWSGAEMGHFAQHRSAPRLSLARADALSLTTHSPTSSRSAQVLEPILTPAMRAHPAWKCWLKLVELYSHVILHKFSVELIVKIDDLQLEYSALYDEVPEYAGLKRPKHHFISHLAPNAYRFGPPRGYWCFGFEAFNKVMKSGARLSNKKNTVEAVMMCWSMRHAREIVRKGQRALEREQEQRAAKRVKPLPLLCDLRCE